MSAAFTPGPWRVIETNLLPYHGDHVADMSNGLMVVASSKLGEPLADARLIAAAPCMLAELTYLRDCIERGTDPAMGRVNAVIAKAQGGAA